MKVLVVDDSLLIRETMKIMLEDLGHIVILAEDGKRAIELYKSKKPDIVTMDLTMPVMNGIASLKWIISMDANAKVIMSTSNGFEQLVIEAIRDGASDYILKPITIGKLAHAIEKVVNKISEEDSKVYSDEDFVDHLFDDM